MPWHPYRNGETIGTPGSESGTILRDEESDGGGRITLERCGSPPYAITCGYRGFVHTAFAGSEDEALSEFESMKADLERHADWDCGSEAHLEWIMWFMDRY